MVTTALSGFLMEHRIHTAAKINTRRFWKEATNVAAARVFGNRIGLDFSGLLFVYHLRLNRQVRVTPLTTGNGLTNHDRRVWVQNIVDQKRDILAVQTFRNWVMASTFLASTAILISLGLVASAFRTKITSSATHALNVFGHPSETLWIIKLFVLSAHFFLRVFQFYSVDSILQSCQYSDKRSSRP
jgi:hypothetical protein